MSAGLKTLLTFVAVDPSATLRVRYVFLIYLNQLVISKI